MDRMLSSLGGKSSAGNGSFASFMWDPRAPPGRREAVGVYDILTRDGIDRRCISESRGMNQRST